VYSAVAVYMRGDWPTSRIRSLMIEGARIRWEFRVRLEDQRRRLEVDEKNYVRCAIFLIKYFPSGS